MRTSNVLSSFLLVGALKLAAPAVASAHQEGRGNCRYAMQQSTATRPAEALSRARQTVEVTLAGIATSVGALDRVIDRTMDRTPGQAAAMMTGLLSAAGEASQMVRATVTTFRLWGPAQILTHR